MTDCIFCRIINKEIPSEMVYEDDNVAAFRDISPQAPVHVLVMPKKHITDILGFEEDDKALLLDLTRAIGQVAQITGIREKGFRVINNCGKAAGQTVEHVHFHVLGGRGLGEKIV